ncbi:CLUMA_CG021636, isoform A [Clunio marinus]|uniref:CLUMA_CG021636, isoform A n=1 Tax=Clunio marinus TaxID=568069 RepID=A0A1J1J847_9DIPT|nr:CLUMA_CG021636, isoform A [Clunio marinus]
MILFWGRQRLKYHWRVKHVNISDTRPPKNVLESVTKTKLKEEVFAQQNSRNKNQPFALPVSCYSGYSNAHT